MGSFTSSVMGPDAGERAWILHRYPYGDSSLVVEALTEGHGRWAVLARGARRQRSRWGVLEPGRAFWMRWTGRGDLPALAGAEEIASVSMTAPVQPLMLFYLNELLLRLTRRGDPHPDLFTVYSGVLSDIYSPGAPVWPLRRFERRLLEILGWATDLEGCAECGRACQEPAADGSWSLVPGAGLYCPGHQDDRPGGHKMGAGAILWLRGSMETGPGPDLLGPLRRYLAAELGAVLGDRPLESRRLLAAYLHSIPATKGTLPE